MSQSSSSARRPRRRRTNMSEDFEAFVRQNDFACWCGERSATVFCRQNFRRRFAALKCLACGTHRILPKAIHDQAQAEQLYNDEHHTRAALSPKFVERNVATILRRIDRLGIRFRPGMTVIDVGCSEGLLVETIRRKWNCRVFGVDVDERTIASARTKFPEVTFLCGLAHGQMRSLPKADVVIASAILEHVTDPPQFVSGLAELLQPGGVLFILTPNARSFHYWVARSWWRELLSVGEHIFLFTPASLELLARRCSLEVVKTITDYDALLPPRLPGSFREVALWGWTLTRFVVKAICMNVPHGKSGDILCAALRKSAPQGQPAAPRRG